MGSPWLPLSPSPPSGLPPQSGMWSGLGAPSLWLIDSGKSTSHFKAMAGSGSNWVVWLLSLTLNLLNFRKSILTERSVCDLKAGSPVQRMLEPCR